MVSDSELQELAGFEGKGMPILSLYLDTDLTQQLKEKCRLVLRDLVERARGSASEVDLAKVERFFDLEYDWQAKAVAIFSAADQDLWRAYPLTVPVESKVHTNETLYLRPLAQLLFEHDRYGVALVGREGTRLFLMHMGQIEQKSELSGADLKHHKQGGPAAARYQRRVEKQAGQNLRLAAEATARFCRENDCHWLILSGSEETVPQFRDMLPKALQKQIIGTLGMDVTASATEVMERSEQLVRDEQRQRNQNLVEVLTTAAAKGAGAVTGLADTFSAIREGRVHILAVEKDFEADGYVCDECNFMSTDPIDKCPFCGGEPKHTRDAVDVIIHRVIKAGGKVETVTGSEVLAQAGHIGAILRY